MDRDQPTEMIPMPTMSEFEVVLRGYDRAQVRDTVERLEADVRIALTDRDAAVARSSDLASQLSAVHAEMESLRRKLANTKAPTYETMGERIANMLRLAEEEAAEIRRNAHSDVAGMREQAQSLHQRAVADQQRAAGEAQKLRGSAQTEAASTTDKSRRQAEATVGEAESRAGRLRSDADRAAAATTTRAKAAADRMLAEATAARDRMLAEAEQRSKQAEHDFEVGLRARRAGTTQEITEQRRGAAEEAERRVSEAKAAAEALVAAARKAAAEREAAADAELRRIEDLRQNTISQLRAVRELLTRLPPEVQAGSRSEQPASSRNGPPGDSVAQSPDDTATPTLAPEPDKS